LAQPLQRSQLTVPLAIYLVNFAFGAIITITQLDVRFWIPTSISILLGVVPAILLWWSVAPDSQSQPAQPAGAESESVSEEQPLGLPSEIPAISMPIQVKG
jgi:putative membrane protein